MKQTKDNISLLDIVKAKDAIKQCYIPTMTYTTELNIVQDPFSKIYFNFNLL